MIDKRANAIEARSTIIGAGLIVVGALFLLVEVGGVYLPAVSWRYRWPRFVVAPGVLMLLGALQGRPRSAGLAVPGSVVTMVGLVLLFQNATNHWHSWAYAWALISPTAFGIGRVMQGWLSGRPDVSRQGRRLVNVGLVLFFGFAIFFELVLNISGVVDRSLSGIVVPILLIGAGVLALVRESRGPADEQRWS